MRRRRVKHKHRRSEAALRLLEDRPPGRVLDAPCGEGLVARELARRGHAVWACDLDPAARANQEGIQFDVVDLNGPLPYPAGFFDQVVCLEGLEHLENMAACLGEFARVLRPGGRLVASAPNVNDVLSRCRYLLTGRFPGFKPIAVRALRQLPEPGARHWHVTIPYLPALAYLLGRHGLRVDAVTISMIKTRRWLFLPLALPMWLGGARAPAGSVARALGSWPLLLGRSVLLRAVKAG